MRARRLFLKTFRCSDQGRCSSVKQAPCAAGYPRPSQGADLTRGNSGRPAKGGQRRAAERLPAADVEINATPRHANGQTALDIAVHPDSPGASSYMVGRTRCQSRRRRGKAVREAVPGTCQQLGEGRGPRRLGQPKSCRGAAAAEWHVPIGGAEIDEEVRDLAPTRSRANDEELVSSSAASRATSTPGPRWRWLFRS